jgi:cephalosporin-C deacetylase-like acetyl esterase
MEAGPADFDVRHSDISIPGSNPEDFPEGRKATAMMQFKRLDWLLRRFVAGAIMLHGFVSLSSCAFAQASASDDATHFSYDNKAALDVKQVSLTVQDGVTVQDITYTGSNGDTVPAYLVIPKSNGKLAGIIWGHWLMPGTANANRQEFLKEAIELAPGGVISLLVDAPQARPNFKPAPNPVLVAQQVIDLRRGMDLLLSRSDVDAKKIAYVGHSWDASNGAILDAVDKRFAAFVFMSGPQSMREYVLSSDSPRTAPMRKTIDMAKVERTMKANAWADPGSYADRLGPAPALFQYGLHDEDWVPLQDAKDYIAMSSGPKTVQFYDADHALNSKASVDRDAFLRKTLNLAP